MGGGELGFEPLAGCGDRLDRLRVASCKAGAGEILLVREQQLAAVPVADVRAREEREAEGLELDEVDAVAFEQPLVQRAKIMMAARGTRVRDHVI